MPELPNVAGFKQYFDATALHQWVRHSHVQDDRICRGVTAGQLAHRLKGRTLDDSRRYGKYLLVRAGDAGWLVFHFGMTGSLDYQSLDDDPPRYTRLALDLDDRHRLAYRCRRMLGHVSMTEDVDQFVKARELGPDALDDGLTLERFRERLDGHGGMLKSLLMNQSFVAGIGNVWADEILFQSKLHPKLHADQLDSDQTRRLHHVMRRVLKVGAKHGGDGSQLPDSWLLPHCKAGADCPRCGGKLRKLTVSGRTSIICPDCQKR